MSTISPPEFELTVEDLAARVGAVPLWRVRTDPVPGAATEEDVERIRRCEDRICELIDGVLVEKAVSDKSAFLAVELATLLNAVIRPRRLGWVLGADGFVRLFGDRLRAPDVSFVRRNQRADQRLLEQGYSDVAPALAVEVFSPGNTIAELERKRAEFFAAGTELFWIVYPEQEQIIVSTGPAEHRTLQAGDILTGGSVLPDFSLRVGDLFAAADLSDSQSE
ncbi:MAG: Uma2 family endonuclease [Planctomycetota bacterium]|nr:MAG: Uma2 family endonuclease [Planctomycetota bacterium]REJ95266.1 MAG: Uma2 family endonuclease [Planctomycetota bacterium]REK26256.1 MAG: Uma2 family endonuclease [Planctomycetota bacterium]REK34388.1 MAG: Uma2 family endonuclease [Planctomycetota bacterium]